MKSEARRFLEDCICKAEELFGQRDPSYNAPQIRCCDEGNPRLRINGSQLFVDLPQSSLSAEDRSEVRWHIAHEAVHVLDPHYNPTNYLEEGLATWFQNKIASDYKGSRWRPWADAESRVKTLMEFLPDALRRFRERQHQLRRQGHQWTKIGDISAEMLVKYCPAAQCVASDLAQKFPRDPNSIASPVS